MKVDSILITNLDKREKSRNTLIAVTVPGVSPKCPIPSLVLVIVRVMNDASLNLTSVPIKCGVAFNTPHLRTPSRSVYKSPTCRTPLGITSDQLYSLNRLWITLMTLGLFLIAVFANILGTKLTVPLAVQKPLSIR